MPWVGGRVHASHRLPTSWDIDLERSVLKAPVFMKVPHHVWQLWQHVEDVVPQPAHKSQSAARSVERAMAASHGTTCWACKATRDAADLVRLQGARRAVHRDLVGAVQDKFFNLCLKGLIPTGTRTPPPILTDWHPSADLGDSGDSRGTPGGSRGTLGELPSASDHLRARPSLRRKRENSDMAYLRTAPSCLALCLALSLLSDA